MLPNAWTGTMNSDTGTVIAPSSQLHARGSYWATNTGRQSSFCGATTLSMDGRACTTPPIDYHAISYYSSPKSRKDALASLEEVDPKLFETYAKLRV